MKYKITLGGRGADVWVHRLNEHQYKLLKESQSLNNMELDEIAKILDRNCVDDVDDVFMGVYDGEDLVVQAFNEGDEMIFDSLADDDWSFDEETRDEHENYESVFEGDDPTLFVESYSKGTFFEFELETEEEFDPTKLSPIILEVGERFEMITGLAYNGEELEKEIGDYWSKGYYFHLI
jgi:hypothetical protein